MKCHLNCFTLSHMTAVLCCWELWLIQIPGRRKWASQSCLYWCPWVTRGPDGICSLVPASRRTLRELLPHTYAYLFTNSLPSAPQGMWEFSHRTLVVTKVGHLCSMQPMLILLWTMFLGCSILLEMWMESANSWGVKRCHLNGWRRLCCSGPPLAERQYNHFDWGQFKGK